MLVFSIRCLLFIRICCYGFACFLYSHFQLQVVLTTSFIIMHNCNCNNLAICTFVVHIFNSFVKATWYINKMNFNCLGQITLVQSFFEVEPHVKICFWQSCSVLISNAGYSACLEMQILTWSPTLKSLKIRQSTI